MQPSSSAFESQCQNLIYLYDLPKDFTSSTKLAMMFKEQAGVVLETRPQIRKDITRPFYSAIVNIKDPVKYRQACEKMKYFEIEGKQCRALQFDKNLMGPNKDKMVHTNIFLRNIPKEMKPQDIETKFADFGQIRSLKVSLNPDHSSRGYGFIQFSSEEQAVQAVKSLEHEQVLQAVVYKPRDRNELRKLFNNVYVKNIPLEMSQEQVHRMFSDHGNIKSLVLMKNNIGQFGFVCYEGEERNYGPTCAFKAIEALNEKDLGDQKLYVRPALKKLDRELEKKKDLMKFKNSKKRCNLYVRNFSNEWTQDQIIEIFDKYGEIENVKLAKNPAGNSFAFVCFKTPDDAIQAKLQLNGTVIEGRPLLINYYEIKEIRQIQIEDSIDKADFEKYIAHEKGDTTDLSDIKSHSGLVSILTQLMNMMNFQDEGQRPGYRQQRFQRRGPNIQNRGQNQGQTSQGGNFRYGYGQAPRQQPFPPQKQASDDERDSRNPMPQPPGRQNVNISQLSPPERYQYQTSQLLPSVVEKNPYLKEQVGTLIFDYVCMIIGTEKAPKITGMLIELPVPQVKVYMSGFEALRQRVHEANALLIETQKKKMQAKQDQSNKENANPVTQPQNTKQIRNGNNQ